MRGERVRGRLGNRLIPRRVPVCFPARLGHPASMAERPVKQVLASFALAAFAPIPLPAAEALARSRPELHGPLARNALLPYWWRSRLAAESSQSFVSAEGAGNGELPLPEDLVSEVLSLPPDPVEWVYDAVRGHAAGAVALRALGDDGERWELLLRLVDESEVPFGELLAVVVSLSSEASP